MRVLVRGIPNFAHVQAVEVTDLASFVESHELRLNRWAICPYGSFFNHQGSRVSLYLEGLEENRGEIESRCFDQSRSAMRSCVIRADLDSGTIRTAGTASSFSSQPDQWYMVDPGLDPRFNALVEKHKEEEARRREAEIRQQEADDALEEEILSVAAGMGYEEALRVLKGQS